MKLPHIMVLKQCIARPMSLFSVLYAYSFSMMSSNLYYQLYMFSFCSFLNFLTSFLALKRYSRSQGLTRLHFYFGHCNQPDRVNLTADLGFDLISNSASKVFLQFYIATRIVSFCWVFKPSFEQKLLIATHIWH